MKNLHEAIQLAEKNGYERRRINFDSSDTYYNVEAMDLMCPLFWQCLGKALGWDKRDAMKDETIKLAGGIPRNIHVTDNNIGYYTLQQMHKFIDHIADNGNIDDFFSKLIK